MADPGEACDDGDVADGDACSAACQPSILALDGPLDGWLDSRDLPFVGVAYFESMLLPAPRGAAAPRDR